MKQSSNLSTIISTALISIIGTLIVVAIALSVFGTERVAQEVSPFVESTQNRLTEGIVPPAERTEPKTDADLILEAVASNRGSSVLLYKNTVAEDTFVARGLMISTDGVIITDEAVIQPGVNYIVQVPGARDSFEAVVRTNVEDLAVLTIDISTTQVAEFTDAIPTPQSLVVALNGEAEVQIATGIITEVTPDALVTNIVGTMVPGTPLVAKDGSIIGLSTVAAQASTDNTFRRLNEQIYSTIVSQSQ